MIQIYKKKCGSPPILGHGHPLTKKSQNSFLTFWVILDTNVGDGSSILAVAAAATTATVLEIVVEDLVVE